MSKIRNTGRTDKCGFRHTCYVATADQNLKDFHNSSLWIFSHLRVISRSQNKNTDFFHVFSLIVRVALMNKLEYPKIHVCLVNCAV